MAHQKRWLTQSNSKLGKADLSVSLAQHFRLLHEYANEFEVILRKEEAWGLLSPETRQALYSLLPAPRDGEPAHNIDAHPLKTRYKHYIEEELRRWQQDLNDGKECKKWREGAMKAGQERAEGKWDAWKQQQRENEWGQTDENDPPKDTEADAEAAGDHMKGEK